MTTTPTHDQSAKAAKARPPTRARRLAPGRHLFGRYRIERRLGRGGSAEVWLAHDDRLDRTVAIKALLPDALPDAAARDRFVAEGRAAAGLNHPAIVPVYDVVGDPSTPAMILRYVDGETLAARLARAGRLDAATAAGIAADLAGALGHAHARGIVHRDVKPGNVLIDAEGRSQLVDFGIASSLVDTPPRTKAGGSRPTDRPTEVLGTLRYMAPEHLRGGPIDGRSDLYSLGLLLYELLTGTPAFDPVSPEALAATQLEGPPAMPPTIPPVLRPIVTGLLATDPADRPASAVDVELRLRAAAADLGGREAAVRSGGTADVPPTIAPGLPAATAGLALLTSADAKGPSPTAMDSSRPSRPRTEPGDDDTTALPLTLTAALPVVAARPAPAPPMGTRVPVATMRRGTGRRRAGVLAGAAGALVVAAIAGAALLGGFWRAPAVVEGSPGPTPPITTASPTRDPAGVAPAPKPKPPNGHHGHGNGKGDG